MSEINKIEYILELLEKEKNDYVCLCHIDTGTYELHANTDGNIFDLPSSGSIKSLLRFIQKNSGQEENRFLFKRTLTLKKVLNMLEASTQITHSFLYNDEKYKVVVGFLDNQRNIIVCSVKNISAADFQLEDDDEVETDVEEMDAEGTMVMELDSQKRFRILEISDEIPVIFNMPEKEFMETFENNPFGGFRSKDRLNAEQLCFQNAFNNASFECIFSVSVNAKDFQYIHFDTRVKVERDSFLFFISIKPADERIVIMQRKLESENELHNNRVQTFDIDLTDGKAYLGQEMQKLFGYPPVLEKIPEPFLKDELVHPDDKRILSTIITDVMSGKPHCEYEIRIKNPKTEKYLWRQVRFTVVNDAMGRPVRALTVVEDVNALKLQEEHFRSVLKLSGVATWDYNISQHYITNATRLSELFGLNDRLVTNIPDSIISTGIIHKDDVSVYLDLHKRLESGELNPECEVRLFNVQLQSYIWYRLRYTILPGDGETYSFAIGNATDINDLKTAQLNYDNEVRTLSEIQGENLLEKCLINLSQNSIDHFRSFSGIHKSEEMVKKNYIEGLMDLIDVCAGEKFGKIVWDAMNPEALINSYKEGKKDLTVEYKRQMPNNYFEWVCTKMNIYQDLKTGDLMCFEYTYDINRKKLKTEALEAIGTQGSDLVALVDVISGRGFTVHLNPEWQEGNWDGIDYDQFCRNYADTIRPMLESDDDYETLHERVLIANLTRQLNYCSTVDFTFRRYHEVTGELVVIRSFFRYLDPECTTILTCTSDITNVIQAEAERVQVLKNALSEANKANTAKTNFLAKMSHDIRTPLNGIMGMTQIALAENDINLVHQYLEQIDTSSQFLLGILNDILDMSKIENGILDLNREKYSIDELKNQIESVIGPLCRNKDQTFNIVFPNNFEFYTDPQKFNQIFINILSNSVKFTGIGGSVSFTIISKYFARNKAYLECLIEDNGCGMSKEFQKHMFEEFTQEKQDSMTLYNGTGLGLAIVKSLVDKMEGTISVESSNGTKKHGTKVTVKLEVEIE